MSADTEREPARRPRSAEQLPETSFVDRYRGTEYDTAPPPPVEPGRSQRRRWRPPAWMWLLVGVALLCVGLAGGVYIAFGSQQTTALGSFVHMTPPPAPVIIVTSPTPDPNATPTPGASPTASPAAWLVDTLHPAGLFIKNMTATDASYHVDINMTMMAAGEQATMAESADVNGTDFAVAATLSLPQKQARIAAVYKAGYFYAKLDDWPWVRKTITVPPVGVLGNLNADAWSRLQYVGPESVDGKLYNHLRLPVTGWPGDSDTMASLGVVMAPPVFMYDVWVDDRGVPYKAAVDATVTTSVDNREVQMAMSVDYEFSKFGRSIKIIAPTKYRQG